MAELFELVDSAALASLAKDALVVRVPRGIRSKQKLLGVYAERLRFPKYFGWNWDALEECLRDLSWLPDNAPIVVVHEDLPFGNGEHRRIYFDILSQWKKSNPRARLVLLPSNF